MKRPVIYIRLQGDCVDWISGGWGDSPKLMRAANAAIKAGKDYKDVIARLKKAKFDVVFQK